MNEDRPNQPMPDTPTALPPAQELEVGLERASALVRVARGHLNEGRTVELSALEGRVSDLLGLAGSLVNGESPDNQPKVDPETKNRLLATLSALLGDLGELEAQLRDAAGAFGGTEPQGNSPDGS